MATVRATIMVVLLIAATNVQAQGPDTFDEPSPAQDVPIDGGVSLLLAGTAAYGIKKLRQHKK
ncbi:MAG TPA: hypothetical protein DCL43_16275 [Chitinophagaceae bacterium]|nr:hypothetical protein [Chitinophagaceae bacterium]